MSPADTEHCLQKFVAGQPALQTQRERLSCGPDSNLSLKDSSENRELKMLNRFINDENGFIVSAEIVLIFTLVFCAVAVGIAVVRDALVHELGDVAEAIGALNQSYNFAAIQAPIDGNTDVPFHATCSGSGFNDREDACDCDGITLLIVAGKNDPTPGDGNQQGDGVNQ